MLNIKNLKVTVENNQILKGVNLEIKENKVHALMGQNGSGKSTLAQTLMGNPAYTVTGGEAILGNKDILHLKPDDRAHEGLYLSFQYPSEVEGVNVVSYLRMIYNKNHDQNLSPVKFREFLLERMKILKIKEEVLHRCLNEGFSGGEKKKMEMLQMLVLEPKLAILDEVDSGLDIDALKTVANAVNYLKERNAMAVFIITHYARILKHVEPDFVHVMSDGVIAKSGDGSLAHELEEKGYSAIV
jgi:Fe-S cluster assembly ATP-binding protein